MSFVYVDTPEALEKASRQWNTDLGIDIEAENNLHHYGAYVSIIQISSPDQNWIVDVLALDDLKPVVDMFLDESVQKIFHDVNFDLRILHHEFGITPKNIFDTQIAAVLLGKEEIGLGSLLEEYFNINKKSKFQMADWTKRPLSKKELSYAVKDTEYLLGLRDILKKELKEKGRWEWAKQEFDAIEPMELHLPTFWDVKGLHMLSDKQRAIFKRLYDVREKLAEQLDKPVHHIISTKRLMNMAKNPPGFKAWKSLQRCHPAVRQRAHEFYEAVKKGAKETISMPKRRKRRYFSKEQKILMQELSEKRAEIADKLNVQRHVIMSKDQMKDIVVNGDFKTLRPWQKALLTESVSA